MGLREIVDGIFGHSEWDWTKQPQYKLTIPLDILDEMREVANRNKVKDVDVARLIMLIGLSAVRQMNNGLGGRITYSDGTREVVIFDYDSPGDINSNE